MSVRIRSAVATCFIGISLAACSSAPDGGDSAVANDAITSGDRGFVEGDKLVTTANLNLREGPSMNARILTVMPRGSSVTVSPVENGSASSNDSADNVDPSTLDSVPDEETDAGTNGSCVETGQACGFNEDCCAGDTCVDDGSNSGMGVCTSTSNSDTSSRDTSSRDTSSSDTSSSDVGASVAQSNPTSGFYYVTYGDQTGWASGAYLRRAGSGGGTDPGTDPGTGSTGSGGVSSGGNSACMSKFASASRVVDGQHSQHKCYHYVKEHLGSALGIGFDGVQSMLGAGYQTNAYDFARWVSADPGGRASAAGFVKSNVSLNALPLGAILVWRPGQCGYSSSAGHIEVNIGGGRACSDFCGHIKTTCGAPTIVVRRKGC